MERLNLIVTLKDGQAKEARLSGAFRPDDNEVSLTWKRDLHQERIPLARVSCLMLAQNSMAELKFTPVDPTEEVEIDSRKFFQVRVPGGQPYRTGFFGMSLDADTGYGLFFFPFSGVRTRRLLQPIGEILEQEGVVSRAEIGAVLAEQEKLKSRRIGEIIASLANVSQKDIDGAVEAARARGTCAGGMRIGECLVAAGLISEEQVKAALNLQEQGRRKMIGSLLVERGVVKPDQILAALATKHRMRFVNISVLDLSPATLESIPADLVQRFRICPVSQDSETLVIATADPGNADVMDVLRESCPGAIELVVAPPEQIENIIARYYPG